ncbi:MAG: hypothetical protein ACE5FT_04030 [Candidatus Nanoarchaeia archaeon]
MARFVVASDIHHKEMYQDIVDLARDAATDGIVLTGDYVNMHTHGEEALRRIQQTVQHVQQSNPESLDQVVGQIFQEGIQAFVHGIQGEYQSINEILGSYGGDIIAIDGNHDIPAIARESMSNAHFIDPGDVYTFKGIKFGSVVNCSQTPRSFGQLSDIAERVRIPLNKFMDHMDPADYSKNDARVAMGISNGRPDILLAHREVESEVRQGESGSLNSGPEIARYWREHGTSQWHGHNHGQLPFVNIGGGSIPIRVEGNKRSIRTVPDSVWIVDVDDVTKREKEYIYYKRQGEYNGVWYFFEDYKEIGGHSYSIN